MADQLACRDQRIAELEALLSASEDAVLHHQGQAEALQCQVARMDRLLRTQRDTTPKYREDSSTPRRARGGGGDACAGPDVEAGDEPPEDEMRDREGRSVLELAVREMRRKLEGLEAELLAERKSRTVPELPLAP